MTPRVREILSWYGSDQPGTLANMARILNQGDLAGSGKILLALADPGGLSEVSHMRDPQGSPAIFAKNPDSYDPAYHLEIAIDSGCSALVAPWGTLESCCRDYAGEIPLILQIDLGNQANVFSSELAVSEALRLGCSGLALSIPLKGHFGSFAQTTALAKEAGLVVVAWADLLSEESSVDRLASLGHLACQLGAHFVHLTVPNTESISNESLQRIYSSSGIKVNTLADRVRHLIQCCFNGRRLILISGVEFKAADFLLEEAKQLALGGAFGSMIGRNGFQRSRKEAIQFYRGMMEAFIGRV